MLTLIQMHGYPGSGKSTVARAVGRALPAIVLDNDVIKSALIRTGTPFEAVGPPSHEVLRALASNFLEDGHSVILDTPCFWPVIEEATRALAAQHGAKWVMLQTICPVDVVDKRLAERVRLESNPERRDLGPMRPGMYIPDCKRMALDTMRPIEENVTIALAYIRKESGA
jgi:predicted kinase